MKLIGLSIEGLRKIKAAELDFDGKNLVQVRGANGAGKSTVLDAIHFLLKGTRDIPAGVVSHGAGESVIVGTIDDYIVRRTIKTDGKSALSVEREGGKVARPQEFLDTISGQFLDPEWFAKLPGPEKRAVLMRYVGIDFTAIDGRIA
ncbi:MAG: AAA family ATPase [Rectinemataceae bacterium]